MAPTGYSPDFKWYADSAELNRYSGNSIEAMGFNGVFPYIGIGGGGTLPDKRLTRARYIDYVSTGIELPGAFVEGGINDADSGYEGGRTNAHIALLDLQTMSADIDIIIAVNDKTTFTEADIAYVRGFRDVVGYNRCGVYGFSDYLKAVHNLGYASYYHQCGSEPKRTGTDHFVNVWQHNNDSYNGLDVNQLLIEWRKNKGEDVINFFCRNGSGDVNSGFTDIVMEVGSLVYETDWSQYLAKRSEQVATLTGLDDIDYDALVHGSDGQKSIPNLLLQMIQKMDMPVNTAAVRNAIGGALKDAGTSLES